MRRIGIFGALALASASLGSCAVAIGQSVAATERFSQEVRVALVDRPARPRRGKGVQAKPRPRPNRLTTSRRVRRKHRRAA